MTELEALAARIADVKRAPLFIKAEAADKALAALMKWAEGIERKLQELEQCRKKSERWPAWGAGRKSR